MKKRISLRNFLGVFISSIMGVSLCLAQVSTTPIGSGRTDKTVNIPRVNADGAPSAETVAPGPATRSFNVAYEQLEKIADTYNEMEEQYAKATPEQRVILGQQMNTAYRKMDALIQQTSKLSEAAWEEDKTNPNVIGFSLFLMASAIDADQYETAYDLARELMKAQVHTREPILYEMAGVSAFMMNKYDVAEMCFKQAEKENEITDVGINYRSTIPYYTAIWKKESALRAQEAAANNLPRVALKTTKGDVVLELFEDQAPNTVANFISLVEKGFYNGNDFHTVMRCFMAQTGSPKEDGTGTPGYVIADECHLPDARFHFRGSVAMAHFGENTAGSQFYITLVPANHLDGKYTVFGRVISGIENISNLNEVDVSEKGGDAVDASGVAKVTGALKPDKIISAAVIRKRDHAYIPKTLPEEVTTDSTTAENTEQ